MLNDLQASATSAPPLPPRGAGRTIRLEPSKGWVALHLREIWHYRDLLAFLVWRDIKVRYKQTALGATWAIIQPLFTMLVFALFFGRLAKMPSDGIPYPLFSLAALVPWQYFASSLTQSSNSVVAEKQLITRTYFPRLIVPLSAVVSTLLDLVVAFCLLLVMLPFYGVIPGFGILAIPGFVLLAMAAALGMGLWLSALNVTYRDFRYTIPFLVQFWLFASPIAYPSSLVPSRWRILYGFNPMVGVVDGFRWALLGAPCPSLSVLGASVLASAVLLTTGLFFFRRMERSFADLV